MRLRTYTIRAPEDPPDTYRARISLTDEDGAELSLTGDPESEDDALSRAARAQYHMVELLKELQYLDPESAPSAGTN